jgi:hypothetical protein
MGRGPTRQPSWAATGSIVASGRKQALTVHPFSVVEFLYSFIYFQKFIQDSKIDNN